MLFRPADPDDSMPTSQLSLPPARNPGAVILLKSNDEWRKAAYYDADAGVFFDYPAPKRARLHLL